MTPEESNSPKQQPKASSPDEFCHLAANLDHFRRSCFEQVKSFTLPSTIGIALFQEREEALRFAKEVAARVLQQPDAKVYAHVHRVRLSWHDSSVRERALPLYS